MVEDDMAILPEWARAPKGKGVTDKLRGDLLDALQGQDLPAAVLKARSWQALVLNLIAFDAAFAERQISSVLTQHRARFSKRYTLR